MLSLRPRPSSFSCSRFLGLHSRHRFGTNANLRADPLDVSESQGQITEIEEIKNIKGIHNVNGINGHHHSQAIRGINGSTKYSDSDSLMQRIRKCSLFPHRFREDVIHSILDRVELIADYDGDDQVDSVQSPSGSANRLPLCPSQQTMIDKLIEDSDQQLPRESAPLNVVDLGEIIRQHVRWTTLLPNVHPFYAVKCNPDPVIITLLDALGASFDCASKSEFDLLLQNGVHIDHTVPEKVVFSHPCKHPLHLEYARDIGVNLCTFDNEYEIEKIARFHPQCQALLRIQVDDSRSKMKFNSKYGFNAENSEEVDRIFDLCRRNAIDLKGIMFHVGSGCLDSSVFGTAIEQSKFLFDVAHRKFGYDPSTMNTVDLGGGFPGMHSEGDSSFEEMAQQIRHSLGYHFGDNPQYRFIAEPGRYYVAKSTSLVCEVIAKKKRTDNKGFMYYLNDGIFGAFSCIPWEDHNPSIVPYQKAPDLGRVNGEVLYPSTIFGPSCDSLDKMYDDYPIREMDILDKVVVPHFGAYTCCLHTEFNGFECPKSRYVMTL